MKNKNKILIVEGDKHLSELWQYALESEGYRTSVVDSAEALMVQLEALEHPELLFMGDLGNRPQPHVALVGLVRRFYNRTQLPIMMVSRHGSPLHIKSCIDAGVDVFVTAPCSPSQVKALIKEHFLPPITSPRLQLEPLQDHWRQAA